MRQAIFLASVAIFCCSLKAADRRVYPVGDRPADHRLGELRTLNSDFPFTPVVDKDAWRARQEKIRRRILISQGLWPLPTKTDLNAVVHRKLEFEDYTIEAVDFESFPGHFVTGSLYRPKGQPGPYPAILNPHGHWMDARFGDAGDSAAMKLIASGAERFINAGRNHHQARCVQLARMGCVAFLYDMTGCCDSIQLGHRPDKADHLDTPKDWGFFSVQAELRLQNMMGLQTWNSIRSIDFLLQQQDVDPMRIGVTGASGGGTQSMILAAIDERVTAAMPCVMVSTAMQGGCTCENAPLLRIDQGNIDIAAAIAPRPLGLTAADDWTRELKTNGFPDLQKLYQMLGHKNRLTGVFHTHFPHNYNHVNRTAMYDFFNRHFELKLESPVLESDFELVPQEKLTVWNEDHPAPSGQQIGDPHEIALLQQVTADSEERLASLLPATKGELDVWQQTVGGAWETIIGRTLAEVGEVRFHRTRREDRDGYSVDLGQLDHVTASEQLPAVTLKTQSENPAGVIVWLSGHGKEALFREDETTEVVGQLLNKGFTILGADLSGQGEFQTEPGALTNQRMWYQQTGTQAWQKFSGYTYGYNHSLFVKRAHDVLTLLKHAQQIAGDQPLHLVGLDEVVGPIALAARSQAGTAVTSTLVDLKDFRFEQITKHGDPMFVSGSVKYGDIDGLLSLCAPHTVVVAGMTPHTISDAVYGAAAATGKLEIAEQTRIYERLQLLSKRKP